MAEALRNGPTKKDQLIPRGLFSKFKVLLRQFYGYLRACPAPAPAVYSVRHCLFFLQLLLPSLFPLCSELWESSRPSSRILRTLSFLAYWGSLWADSSLVIAFSIGVAAMFISCFMIVIAALLFGRFRRLHPTMIWFEYLVNDICMPVMLSWPFGAIGYSVGRMVAMGAVDSTLLIFSIIFGVLVITIYIIAYCFHFLSVSYHPHSSIFWFSQGHSDSILATNCIVLLSAFVSVTTKTARAVGAGILIALYIFMYVWEIYHIYYISARMAIAFETLCATGGCLAIVQFVHLVVFTFDQDLVLFVGMVLLVAFFFICSYRYNRDKLNHLAIVEQLADDPETFPEIVTAPLQVIRLYRYGFETANPYLLAWDPFTQAMTRWGSDPDLLHQYLRLLAIFPEFSVRLKSIIDQAKLTAVGRPVLIGVRKLAKSILLSRARRMPSSAKRQLKQLRRRERFIGATQTAYWTSISGGDEVAVFDIAEVIMQEHANIESEYLQLIAEYPNCWEISRKFGKFLRKKAYDVQEARYWAERSAYLYDNEDIRDSCLEQGSVTFPRLPRTSSRDKGEHVSGHEGDDSSRFGETPAQATGEDDGQEDLQLVNDQHQSVVMETGRHVPLPFVTHLRIAIIFHFLVIVTMSCFVPVLPINNILSSISPGWRMIEAATIFANRINELDILFATDCAYIWGIMLNESETAARISDTPSPERWLSDRIANRVKEFNTGVNTLQNSIISALDSGADTWKYFYSQSITFQTPNRKSYNLTLGAAMEFLTTLVFEFPLDTSARRESYVADSWLENVQLNSWRLLPAIYSYCDTYYVALHVMTDEARSSVNTIIIIMVIVNVAFWVFCVIRLSAVSKNWRFVALGISQLPKSQIHHCITQLGGRKTATVAGEERIYMNDGLQLASASGGFLGLPVVTILIIIFVQVLFCILGVCLVTFIGSLKRIHELVNMMNVGPMFSRPSFNMFRTGSLLIYWLAANQHRPDIVFPAWREWNETSLALELMRVSALITDDFNFALFGTRDQSTAGLLTIYDRNYSNEFLTPRVKKFEPAHGFFSVRCVEMYIGLVYNAFDKIIQNITMALDKGDDFANFSIDIENMEWLISQHLISHHWYSDTINTIAAPKKVLVEQGSFLIYDDLIRVTWIPLILALITTVLLLWYLTRVTAAFHYCLSSLCAIDFRAVMENHLLAGIFAGVFPQDDKAVFMVPPIIKAIHNFTREVIFQLAPDMTITAVNPVIETHWHIHASSCIDTNLSLVVGFDPSVTDPLGTHRNITVTLIHSQTTIPVNSTGVPVIVDGEVQAYVLFFEDLGEIAEQGELLRKETAEAEGIIQSIIPKSLRPKVLEQIRTLTYVANWIAVLCVQIADYGTFAKKPNQTDALRLFRDGMDQLITDMPDVWHVKSVGISEYILFSSADDNPDVTGTAKLLFNACQSIKTIAEGHGIQIQFGASAESEVVMGLMTTDNVTFDMFSTVARVSRIMAAKAAPNTLYVNKIGFPTFPSAIGAAPVTVNFKNGSVSYVGFECHV